MMRTKNIEPKRPPQLVGLADEARTCIQDRINAADLLVRTTVLPNAPQALEIFLGNCEHWSKVTYDLLMRLFDQDEYAKEFRMKDTWIRPSFASPNVIFNKQSEALREKIRYLQTLLEIINSIEKISEPPRTESVDLGSYHQANTINFSNSNIGTLNLGEIQGNVANRILAPPPSADQFKVALDALLKAVAKDSSLTEDQRREAMEHIEFLVDVGRAEPAKRRLAVVRSALEGLSRLLSISSQVHQVWQEWQPTISRFLLGHH